MDKGREGREVGELLRRTDGDIGRYRAEKKGSREQGKQARLLTSVK